jgi:hypothetical protein
MGRGRLITFGLFAIGAAAAMAGYAVLNFEQPPGFSELPDGWFVRSGRDPAAWTAPGANALEVTTSGALNLEIIPEDRAEVAALLKPANGAPPQTLRPGPDNAFVIATDARARCPATRRADAPTLVLRTPRSVQVRTRGAIAADVGPAERLQIISTGCAAWRVTSANQLWAALAKNASLRGGRVEDARLNLRGRSVAEVETIGRSLDLVSRGPGRVAVGRLDGMVDAELWGPGRLDVGSGFAGQERLWVKGRGHIFHRGEAGIVSAEARLGGKIRIRQARGVISGAGDVEVGRPNAPVAGF